MEFYYMSSNGQIRDSSGELYHAAKKSGWQKDDHKYIKREWKNGKWIYTYKNDVKKSTKSSAIKVGNKVIPVGEKIEKIVDKINKFSSDRKKDWEESKDRATEKAKAEAAKEGATLNDTNKKHSSTTIIETSSSIAGSDKIGKSKTVIKNRGTREQFIDTAKEYIKDRLGYDEKDTLDEAAARYEYAQRAVKNYQDRVYAATKNMGKIDPYDGSISYTDEEKKRIEKLGRELAMLGDLETRAGKEASEAADAYFNTTIGKLESAGNAIEDGKEYVKDRIEDLSDWWDSLAPVQERKKRKK